MAPGRPGPRPKAPCQSVGGPARPARGCSRSARARVPGGGERASWGRREGSASAAVQEGCEGRAGERRGTHSPPHAAVRESQSSRSACTQRRRSMLLLGRAAAAPGPGGGGGRAPRGGERREPRTVRACVRARSSRGSPAAPRGLAACRARSPPPLRQPPSPAAGQRRQAGLRGRLRGRRRALSRRLAARQSLRVPVAQAASENAPRSLQGLHFVACGLAASPLGHVVIGRAGVGGGQEEGEGASLPHRPPPGTHSAAPARAREGTSRWPHNKGGTAAPTTHNRSQDNARLAGGQRVWET